MKCFGKSIIINFYFVYYCCLCVFTQILMNVQRTLTTVLRIALTLLVATSVSAMMDTLWTLTSTLAMVSLYTKQNNHRIGHYCSSDNDECLNGNNSCHANSMCTNTDGGYECECLPGFDGDGFNCTSK